MDAKKLLMEVVTKEGIITKELVAVTIGESIYVDLTPHAIDIVVSDNDVVSIPPSGLICRRDEVITPLEPLDGIPLTKVSYGDVYDIPKEIKGIKLIVSRMIKDALPDRNDLLVPGMLVRDKEGRILGCGSLSLT